MRTRPAAVQPTALSPVPALRQVPMAASDEETAQQQVSGGGGEEGCGERCVWDRGVTGLAGPGCGVLGRAVGARRRRR